MKESLIVPTPFTAGLFTAVPELASYVSSINTPAVAGVIVQLKEVASGTELVVHVRKSD